jgi:methylenetetrahydrofolate--tRNA-(uracil-5-)-methyltransferase
MQPIHVIGGGLAGSEAAWQIASRGVPVVLHEMRPDQTTAAHKTAALAELVCSNSFRSDDRDHNAVGLLHEEMRRLGSLVMHAADANQVPAGGALAVDRDGFSQAVTDALASQPLIRIARNEIAAPPEEWDNVIVATGPLTSPPLAAAIRALTGEDALAFFDAIAPIVHRETIDMSVAWFQSRYDHAGPGGTGADYINCPLDRAQYEAFVAALLAGDRVSFHGWETATPYFDGCLPIEVMAERGPDTLRFGPMKPVGLSNPHRPGVKPYAVVQLRQDNRLGTLFNMVGFQTKLKHGEQVRVFRMIPGLEQAEFARLGGLHRNTFLNSPRLLDPLLRLKAMPRLRFAGQITGCEGYVESAAVGLMAGRFAAAERRGEVPAVPPPTTAHGALLAHITGGHVETIDAGPRSFQPMNVNFGLFPPLAKSVSRGPDGERLRGTAKAIAKRRALTARALAELDAWRYAVDAPFQVPPLAPSYEGTTSTSHTTNLARLAGRSRNSPSADGRERPFGEAREGEGTLPTVNVCGEAPHPNPLPASGEREKSRPLPESR